MFIITIIVMIVFLFSAFSIIAVVSGAVPVLLYGRADGQVGHGHGG